MLDAPGASAITYVGLPKSSGGAHHLGRMSRRVAYARTVSFLQTCTEQIGNLDYALSVMKVPQLRPIPDLEKQIERRFGPSIGPTGAAHSHVRLEQGRVGDVLDFLDEIEPQPTNEWGMAPIWFWVTSKFRILDRDTGRALPGQDPLRYGGMEYSWQVPLGSSGLRLILSNEAAVGIDLSIPAADDDLIRRVVPWLEQHLPFKFSPRHWRAWTPTRSGSFKARKYSLPSRDIRAR
jgi:hypothetical protein